MLQIRHKSLKTKAIELLSELPADGGWLDLSQPTDREVERAAAMLDLPIEVLKAPLDDEERPRIESDEKYMLIILDLPHLERDLEDTLVYQTYPLGIIITPNAIATVSLFDNVVMRDFREGRIGDFSTAKRGRFSLQIVREIAASYLTSLRRIDDLSLALERSLRQSMRNEELFQMLSLGKSLVYFSTSLKSNQAVLRRMMRLPVFTTYGEDAELLEDVIIETEQAIEMADIYMNILNSTMDAFASIISNNLNVVMKVLTSATIVMAVPTVFGSWWGMNVPVPLNNSPFGFAAIVALSLAVAAAVGMWLRKRNLF